MVVVIVVARRDFHPFDFYENQQKYISFHVGLEEIFCDNVVLPEDQDKNRSEVAGRRGRETICHILS